MGDNIVAHNLLNLNSMPTERLFKGKNCRYYRDGYIWCSYDGSVIAYNHNGKTHYPRRRKLPNGQQYVEDAIGNAVSIPIAVCTCWCKPFPRDGRRYELSFIDGNPLNYYYKNLEWVPYHYKHTTADSITIFYEGEILTVYKDARIMRGKEDVHICDQLYHPDIGLFCYLGPMVMLHKQGFINGYPVDVDMIMKAAGYVQGDDADMKDPKIFHRDYNCENNNSDNLEFVEADDPRFVDYYERKMENRKKKAREINPGKIIPDYWN